MIKFFKRYGLTFGAICFSTIALAILEVLFPDFRVEIFFWIFPLAVSSFRAIEFVLDVQSGMIALKISAGIPKLKYVFLIVKTDFFIALLFTLAFALEHGFVQDQLNQSFAHFTLIVALAILMFAITLLASVRTQNFGITIVIWLIFQAIVNYTTTFALAISNPDMILPKACILGAVALIVALVLLVSAFRVRWARWSDAPKLPPISGGGSAVLFYYFLKGVEKLKEKTNERR